MTRRLPKEAAADLSNLAKLAYLRRVNRAIDYIFEHLGSPLSLKQVSKAGGFSPYHFHRIFSGLVGETLNAFVKRVRLERALYLMSHKRGASLTEVALACGFASSSDFSRSFKKQFGCAPRDFDLKAHRHQLRERLQLKRLPAGENPDGFSVRLRSYAERHVAYVRVKEPFKPGGVTGAAARLVEWAEGRGLSGGAWYGYMWEDPEVVPLEKCRYDVAVETPEPLAPEGEIGVLSFPPMTVAELDVVGSIELEQRALDYLYHTWLPSSGLSPDHQPAFEAWNGLPFEHGDAHFELRVQLPVIGVRGAP